MARKHDTKKVREAIEAMEFAEVGPKEILRRLREDDCGIGYKVDIKIRSVQYHLKAIREQRARETTQRDTLVGTIGEVKLQAAQLLAEELATFAARPRGKMTEAQVGVVERIHRAATNIEQREAKKRPPNPANPNSGQEPEETLWDKLARQEREQGGEDGSETEPPRRPEQPLIA